MYLSTVGPLSRRHEDIYEVSYVPILVVQKRHLSRRQLSPSRAEGRGEEVK